MAEAQALDEHIDDIPMPPTDLVFEDGDVMESEWHRVQMNLLIHLFLQAAKAQARTDVYVGGNNFIYYCARQAEAVRTEPYERTMHFRGPDVFVVTGVPEPGLEREGWVVWKEGGRYPDLIIELLSKKTAKIDRTTKKDIYETTFRTPEYILYDRKPGRLEGFRLHDGRYQPMPLDGDGRLAITSVGELRLGPWRGHHEAFNTTWLRLYDASGKLVPTAAEEERARAEEERARAEEARSRADAEHSRADAEHSRAEALAAEVARLRARLDDAGR